MCDRVPAVSIRASEITNVAFSSGMQRFASFCRRAGPCIRAVHGLSRGLPGIVRLTPIGAGGRIGQARWARGGGRASKAKRCVERGCRGKAAHYILPPKTQRGAEHDNNRGDDGPKGQPARDKPAPAHAAAHGLCSSPGEAEGESSGRGQLRSRRRFIVIWPGDRNARRCLFSGKLLILPGGRDGVPMNGPVRLIWAIGNLRIQRRTGAARCGDPCQRFEAPGFQIRGRASLEHRGSLDDRPVRRRRPQHTDGANVVRPVRPRFDR